MRHWMSTRRSGCGGGSIGSIRFGSGGMCASRMIGCGLYTASPALRRRPRAFRGRRHDLEGKPGAGNPHARFDERGTGNAVKGAGLRPGAKATDKPPDPKTGAPAPDSTGGGGDDVQLKSGYRHLCTVRFAAFVLLYPQRQAHLFSYCGSTPATAKLDRLSNSIIVQAALAA